MPSPSYEGADGARSLRRQSRVEVIPLPSLSGRVAEIPPASRLSVTCSPSQGVAATVEWTERLRARGHDAIPHLAARQVESRARLREIVARLDAAGVREAFVIGGDVREAAGPYSGALELASDYAEASALAERFGFAAYPEGHPDIPDDVLLDSLHRKQELVESLGGDGYLSTQMCFSAPTVVSWIRATRAAGIALPIRLGLPGRVDRRRLASISGRLGIGASLRFLRKNRASVTGLLRRSRFEPTKIAAAVLAEPGLGLAGLHLYSFNNVGPTFAWFAQFAAEIEERSGAARTASPC